MPDRMSTDRMGFQGHHPYARGYLADYDSYTAPAPTQTSQWTDLSSQPGERQGFVTVLEDPYKGSLSAPANAPPTLSLPSLSNSSSFYPSQPVDSSPVASPTFSSSYSTLSHWDNYKSQTSNLRTWPEHTMNAPDSSPWYQPDGSTTWGHIRPELNHHGIPVDSQDWDRAEYRAGRSMRLDVGPQRETSFTEELQRLQGNGA